MLSLICVVLLLVVPSTTMDLLGDEMINLLNSNPNMTWVAGKNFAVSTPQSILYQAA